MIKKLQVVKNESNKYIIYLFSTTSLEMERVSCFDRLDVAVKEAERLVRTERIFGATYGVMTKKAWDRL